LRKTAAHSDFFVYRRLRSLLTYFLTYLCRVSLLSWKAAQQTQQGATAKQAAENKTAKYQELQKTYTSSFRSPLRQQAHGVSKPIELVQEVGRRISAITEDNRETVFPKTVCGSAKGKCGHILRHFSARLIRSYRH